MNKIMKEGNDEWMCYPECRPWAPILWQTLRPTTRARNHRQREAEALEADPGELLPATEFCCAEVAQVSATWAPIPATLKQNPKSMISIQ